MKVYLAGPDVFLPTATVVGRMKKDICTRFGLVGLFPLDNEIAIDSVELPSLRIFRGNTEMMDEADAIIANLTPFRGPSADAGTIYELGFMVGRGKLCAGYSNIVGSYREKVRATGWTATNSAVDVNGMKIEDFDLVDNLMIVHALDLFGIPIVVPKQSAEDPIHDLSNFEACVKLVAARSVTTLATRPVRRA